ncbi:SLAIN motif-containing protein 1-like [Tachysurus ichikawai]
MSRVFSLLRQARNGPRIKTALVKDSDGNLIATEANCLERWKEHFSLLLQHGTSPANRTISLAANAAAPSVVCSTSPVTPEEVRAALGKLNNRKAPGICAITAEMLKSGGKSIVEWLTGIFNEVWETERLPSDWTRGVILPFWKRKGDRLVCGNHRGITLLSIPGKLFTRILLTHALPAIRSRRRPQQAGFMPNRSTIDQISAVHLLIEKTYEFHKDRHLYTGFIDLKAAFDAVCHTYTLWSILHTLGVPPKIVALFKLLYSNAQSCVRINGRDSDWFPISSGVRQGCVAAPDLFNCITDHLMSRVWERVPRVSFRSYHLTDLEYADDTILLSTSYSQLRDALAIYSEEAEKLGLQVSWTKTKFMYIGDRPHPPSLQLGNDIVELVKNLGSIVTDNGDVKPEITRRRALAASALQSLWKPLWRHQTISRKTKLRIYNSALLSILLYGSETWPLNKTLAARLDGFDSRALRTIENIRWPQRVSNQMLRARTCQPRASSLAAQRRTCWLGHVLRLPSDHPTRAILEFDLKAAGWR